MKFTKLSLAALAAITVVSSASAVENVKVDGQLKLWYQTAQTSAPGGSNLFEKGTVGSTNGGSIGDFVANVGVAGDLTKNVGFGMRMYAVTTMGLENNLVSGEAINNTATNGVLNGQEKNPYWLGEAYFTYKAGNTIAKLGRQELPEGLSPLAYSETWNAAPNTFEAAAFINNDIPNTTVAVAYVGKGDGESNTLAGPNLKTINAGAAFANYQDLKTNAGAVLGAGGAVSGGALAIIAVNNSITNLTIHPAYYSVNNVANAFWLDAAYNVPSIAKIEAQYADVKADGFLDRTLKVLGATDTTTDAYAVRVSGDVYGVKLGASYSSVDKGVLPVGNTATNFATTPIYTAGVGGTMTGMLAGAPDTTGYKIDMNTKLYGIDLGAYYNSFEMKSNNGGGGIGGYYQVGALGIPQMLGTLPAGVTTLKPSSSAITAGAKVDQVNLLAAYVAENNIGYDATGNKLNQKVVRVVASINF